MYIYICILNIAGVKQQGVKHKTLVLDVHATGRIDMLDLWPVWLPLSKMPVCNKQLPLTIVLAQSQGKLCASCHHGGQREERKIKNQVHNLPDITAVSQNIPEPCQDLKGWPHLFMVLLLNCPLRLWPICKSRARRRRALPLSTASSFPII